MNPARKVQYHACVNGILLKLYACIPRKQMDHAMFAMLGPLLRANVMRPDPRPLKLKLAKCPTPRHEVSGSNPQPRHAEL